VIEVEKQGFLDPKTYEAKRVALPSLKQAEIA
jgi:hypothetical protein